MYQPKAFQETDIENISYLVRDNPLGTLVVANKSGFEVNHIPFVLDVENTTALCLRAHIPKANPLVELVQNSESCVVIFHGADGYISPSWYSTKKKHGKVVPTWNYSVVHIHGKLTLVEEKTWLVKQLEELTNQKEQNRTNQWQVSDAPKGYTEKQLSFLVGIEITSTKVEAKTKGSQNQPMENRNSVMSSIREEQPESEFRDMMESVNSRG